MMNQSDAGHVGIFSSRTNQTQGTERVQGVCAGCVGAAFSETRSPIPKPPSWQAEVATPVCLAALIGSRGSATVLPTASAYRGY
eukprot:145454-Prorocentrum_minimum.AAC.1